MITAGVAIFMQHAHPNGCVMDALSPNLPFILIFEEKMQPP